MKIYHNTRCSKSRQAYQLLLDAGKNPEVIEYMKSPISKKELTDLIKLLGIDAYDLVRKKEKIFLEKFKSQDKDKVDWVAAMIEYPNLMERPIYVANGKATIGRPPENVLNL